MGHKTIRAYKQVVQLLGCCVFIFPCLAQDLNYIHYNTNNSTLPHDIVYQLNQDPQSFLWISTDNGLVRFDGMEMKNYEKGLQSRYVISTNTEKGILWISTWKGGIHYMENDSMRLVETDTNTVSAFQTNGILVYDDFIISHRFKSYIVYRFDKKNNLLRYWQFDPQLPSVPDRLIEPGDPGHYRFLRTKDHQLYGYNSTGIYVLNNGKFHLVNSKICPDELWESPSGDVYYRNGPDIYLTDHKFSTSSFIYRIPLSRFTNTQIVSFYVLPSGNICVGFSGSGKNFANPVYFLINTRTGDIFDLLKEVRAQALSTCLLIDKEGGIWLSTDGNGLYHIFDRRYTLISGDKIFYNSSVTDMYMWKDSLFIGTKKGVYTYYKKRLIPVKGSIDHKKYHVNRFFLTPEGGLAVSSKAAFPSYVLSPGPVKKSSWLEAYVLNTYVFENTWDVSAQLTDKNNHFNYSSQFQIPSPITDLEEDEKNTLWIGTQNGLYYFNRDEGCVKFNGVHNCIVNDLLYNPEHGLWVGTTNGLYLVANNRVLYWGGKEGLTNANINCLYAEGRSVWIGTQNGLFNLQNGGLLIYKKRDGLIADDVTCFAKISGNLLAIGSSKGISLLYTDVPGVVEHAPELFMEKILVNDQPHVTGNHVTLPFNSTVELYYNAVSFTYPELLEFQYRLNENEPWIKTQNRSLVFTNLQPGNYHLMLKVKKHNSGFGEPFEFFIRIKTPWWKSNFFYAGIFGLGILLLYVFFQLRINGQKNKQQLAELRMKALQTQLNPHFISNALNAIQLFILKQDELKANEYLTRFAELTRLLLETSRTRFISLHTEQEILNLYVSFEKLRFEDKFEYSIIIDPDIDTSKFFLPGMLIQPFVENSINHGILYLDEPVRGELTIHITKYNEGLKIIITDNGIGREKAQAIRNRNSRSYKSRSTEIANEIQQAVNSLPGCFISIETKDRENEKGVPAGTTVTILVVIDPKFYKH